MILKIKQITRDCVLPMTVTLSPVFMFLLFINDEQIKTDLCHAGLLCIVNIGTVFYYCKDMDKYSHRK